MLFSNKQCSSTQRHDSKAASPRSVFGRISNPWLSTSATISERNGDFIVFQKFLSAVLVQYTIQVSSSSFSQNDLSQHVSLPYFNLFRNKPTPMTTFTANTENSVDLLPQFFCILFSTAHLCSCRSVQHSTMLCRLADVQEF